MRTRLLRFMLTALLLALAAPLARAQAHYDQAELDRMLAPVALYPDALLSQVLMAATYPAEVEEAAAWSRRNPGLRGEAAVQAALDEDWDPSVKSLVAFPQVLQRMADNPNWMLALGDAFLMQQPHVMQTVQQLRRRAWAAGHLRSDADLRVVDSGSVIVIEPAQPRIVYVPYYDPWVVYGTWWWPHYPPVVWTPWPRYAVVLSAGFFFGTFDWHRHHVRIVHVNNYYYRPAVVQRTVIVNTAPGVWRHERQRHRAAVRPPNVERARHERRVEARREARLTETRREQLRQEQRARAAHADAQVQAARVRADIEARIAAQRAQAQEHAARARAIGQPRPQPQAVQRRAAIERRHEARRDFREARRDRPQVRR